MEEFGVTETTPVLRLRLQNYLRWFMGELEAMTDRIVSGEEDLAIQEAALRFRVHAVPQMQAALLQRDPLAALAAAWALTAALRQYVGEGNGKDLFGASQPVAVETFQNLEREIVALVDRTVSPEKRQAVAPEFAQWIRDNPIEDSTLGFRPKGVTAAELTAAAWGSGGLRSIANLDETARDLSDQINLYVQLAPNEARRQGELLVVESRLASHAFSDLDSVERRIASVDANIDRIAAFVLATPGLIASERTVLLGTLEKERGIVLASVDRQRVETLKALQSERETIFAGLEELRRATFQDVSSETERSLGRIDAMRTETLAELDRASRAAVDHLFWRALQLLLVALIGAGALSLLLTRMRLRAAPR
jgi:hypothetical protein